MASTTDTLPGKTGDVTQEVRPPRTGPRSRGRLAVVAWAAATVAACAAVAAIAVGALTGDDDEAPKPANRVALEHQAEQYERQAHLEGQGRTHGRDSAVTAPSPTGNRAALKAEADRYVKWLESRAASVTGGGASSHGFVPGSRHMPTAVSRPADFW